MREPESENVVGGRNTPILVLLTLAVSLVFVQLVHIWVDELEYG